MIFINKNIGTFIVLSLVFTTIFGCTKKKTEDLKSTEFSNSVLESYRTYLTTNANSTNNATQTKLTSELSELSLSLTSAQIDILINAAKTQLQSSNLNTSKDLAILLPAIIKSIQNGFAAAKIDTASTSGALSLISKASLNTLSTTSTGTTATKPELLKAIAKTVFENMDETGLSSTDIATTSKTIMGSLVGALSLTGITKTDLTTSIKALTEGAVGALSGISTTGFSVTTLPDVIKQISAGAVGAIANTGIAGVVATDLKSLVNACTEGVILGFDDITLTGYGVTSIPGLIKEVANGSISALKDITMTDYSVTNYGDLIKEISSAATDAVAQIDNPNFDINETTALSNLAEGAGTGLTQLQGSGITSNQLAEYINDGIRVGNSAGDVTIPSGGFNFNTEIATGTQAGTTQTSTPTATASPTPTPTPTPSPTSTPAASDSIAPIASSVTLNFVVPEYMGKITLTVPAATDDVTAKENLLYEVRVSSGSTVATLSNALLNGGVIKEL